MRNRFPGICYRCGKKVAAGAGHFERVTADQREKWPGLNLSSRWLTQHAECAIKWRGTSRHYRHNPIEKSE